MRRDAARAVVDLDPVLGLARLDTAADQSPGRRVAVGVDVDVSLAVDDPLVEPVALGHVARQRRKARPLDREELARAGVQVALGRGVDLVAPSPRLAVDVGPVVKLAAGQEVVVDVVEGTLDAGGPVGVALLVRREDAAETLREARHRRYWHHVLPRAG